MFTLDRYITRHANRYVLTVTLTLLALISMYALFEELDEAYGFWEAMAYVARTLPRRFDEILVYSLFLGYLIALGSLAEHRELTVCRTAGMSITRLILALTPSLVLWLGASLAVSEYVAPNTERSAEVEKMKAQFGDDAVNRMSTLWFRYNNLFMQVQAINEQGEVLGVQQFIVDDDRALIESLRAKTATYDEARQRWTLHEGARSIYGDDGARTVPFDTWTWNNPITPEVLASQAFLDPNKMSMAALLRQIDFARAQQLGVSEYELAFWSRVFKPITFIGLTLLALSVVIGPLREVGMGARLTVGIFAGLGFKYMQDLFAPAALVFNIPAQIAILIPIAAYWAVALLLIRRNV